MQRAGDARALERLRRAVLLAQRHQAGHLVLGELDLLAAEVGQADVGDLVVGGRAWWSVIRSPWVEGRCAAAAASSFECFSCSKRSQSAAGTSLGTLGLGLEPAVDGRAQPGILAQALREGDVGEAELVLPRAARAGCAGAAARPGRRGGSRTPERAGATSPTRST